MGAKNSSKSLFNQNFELCDNSTITIGIFFRINTLQPIEDYMNGNILLIKRTGLLIIIIWLHFMLTVLINYETTIDQSIEFYLNYCTLYLNQISVIATIYNGLMCDKSNIHEWNNIKGCRCIGINLNISNLLFLHSIWIEDQTYKIENIRRQVTYSDLWSTKFSSCYLTGKILALVRKSTLNQISDLF